MMEMTVARQRKDPKPYTLKQRRGERPFQYSTEYGAWNVAVRRGDEAGVRAASRAWANRYSPARGFGRSPDAA